MKVYRQVRTLTSREKKSRNESCVPIKGTTEPEICFKHANGPSPRPNFFGEMTVRIARALRSNFLASMRAFPLLGCFGTFLAIGVHFSKNIYTRVVLARGPQLGWRDQHLACRGRGMSCLVALGHLQLLAFPTVKSGARIGWNLDVESIEFPAGIPGRCPEIGVFGLFFTNKCYSSANFIQFAKIWLFL
jgi:hypothetical protein